MAVRIRWRRRVFPFRIGLSLLPHAASLFLPETVHEPLPPTTRFTIEDIEIEDGWFAVRFSAPLADGAERHVRLLQDGQPMTAGEVWLSWDGIGGRTPDGAVAQLRIGMAVTSWDDAGLSVNAPVVIDLCAPVR